MTVAIAVGGVDDGACLADRRSVGHCWCRVSRRWQLCVAARVLRVAGLLPNIARLVVRAVAGGVVRGSRAGAGRGAFVRNASLVAKHEIVTTLGKKSFSFMTFFPLIIMAFSLYRAVCPGHDAERDLDGRCSGRVAGYVDVAGIIVRLPQGCHGRLKPLADHAAARQALDAGQIRCATTFSRVTIDRTRSVITDQAADFAPMAATPDAALRFAIDADLTGSGAGMAAAEPDAGCEDWTLAPRSRPMAPDYRLALPLIMMFVLFFVITMSRRLYAQCVAKEKESARRRCSC